MTIPPARRSVTALLVAASTAAWCGAADSGRPGTDTVPLGTPAGSPSSSAAAARARIGSAKGPLPDPVLLDGSTQPADKKPEHGMLGEFELPGDENAPRGSKVGGQQNPNQQGGGGGQQQQTAANSPQGGGGGSPDNQQQSQGGGGGTPPPAGGQQGMAGGPAGAQSAGATQAGGGQAAGAQANAAGAAGGPGGPNDPNATAQGVQVGSLTGQGSAQNSIPAGAQKPGAVAIGDSAMRIQTMPNPSNVVGAVPSGPVQQMEKAIGQAAKATTGDNSNRGAERGRAMPSGL